MAARTKRALQVAAAASTAITLLMVLGELRYLDSAAAYAEYLLLTFAFYFSVIAAGLLVIARIDAAVKGIPKPKQR